MGKQAAPKVQAGAEGTGATGEVFPEAPALRLVSSPKRQKILEGMLEVVGTQRLRRGIRAYGARSDRPLPAGLLRRVRRQGRLLPGGIRLRRGPAGSRRAQPPAAAEESWQGQLRAGLGALLDALDADPDLGRALIVEVHAAGPEALKRRSEAMKRVTDFIDSARHASEGAGSPPPIAAEGIVAGMHAVVHARLATGEEGGFRELLPEFMYFAVLPYFGAEMAGAEMQAAKA